MLPPLIIPAGQTGPDEPERLLKPSAKDGICLHGSPPSLRCAGFSISLLFRTSEARKPLVSLFYNQMIHAQTPRGVVPKF